MTILDTLTDLLRVETQLKALGARKAQLRDSLDAEARSRWESDGAVPSWKVARLGSATLAGTDSTDVDVVDEDAFNEWAGNEHPDLVQAVIRLPLDAMVRLFLELDIVDTELSDAVRYEVSPALLTALAKDGAATPDGQLVTEDGAIVPGVKVVPKRPYLMVRLDPQAKNRALAEMAVEPESVSVSPGGVMSAVEHHGDVIDVPSVAALASVQPSGSLVRAAAPLADVEAAFREYTALCDRLLDGGDVQNIQGKMFRKKSAWRKLAVAFGVSCRIVDREYERDDRGRIVRAEVVVSATAPNGRSMDGLGACDLFEKCCAPGCFKAKYRDHYCCPADCSGAVHFSNPQHDLPATAATRATNRACADLFGMGEVSAEEVTDRSPVDHGTDSTPKARGGEKAATEPGKCTACGNNTRRMVDGQPLHAACETP